MRLIPRFNAAFRQHVCSGYAQLDANGQVDALTQRFATAVSVRPRCYHACVCEQIRRKNRICRSTFFLIYLMESGVDIVYIVWVRFMRVLCVERNG